MAAPPDPSGHHDDLDPDQVAELDLLVPDDARELTTRPTAGRPDPMDRPRRRTGRAPRPGATDPEAALYPSPFAFPFSRQRRLTLTAIVVVAAVAVAGLSGMVGTMVFPGSPSVAASAPLASPTAAPGELGGLLADVQLQGLGPISARDLRPMVLVLVPQTCTGCAATLVNLQRLTDAAGIRLTVVGTVGQQEQLAALSDVVGGAGRTVLLDPTGELVGTYASDVASDDLTLVLVRDDAVVMQIARNPSFDLPSASDLHSLTEPATPSA
jgi:hypothetical protein